MSDEPSLDGQIRDKLTELIKSTTGCQIPGVVWDRDDLTLKQKNLFGRVFSLTLSRGYCFAGNDWLAEDLNVSNRTVRRHLKVLEDKGLIERQMQKTKHGTKRIIYAEIKAVFQDVFDDVDGIAEKIEKLREKEGETHRTGQGETHRTDVSGPPDRDGQTPPDRDGHQRVDNESVDNSVDKPDEKNSSKKKTEADRTSRTGQDAPDWLREVADEAGLNLSKIERKKARLLDKQNEHQNLLKSFLKPVIKSGQLRGRELDSPAGFLRDVITAPTDYLETARNVEDPTESPTDQQGASGGHYEEHEKGLTDEDMEKVYGK